MGQQQLLLIVLGVIIVGIAVAAGIIIFQSSAAESNRDQVISDLMSLSTLAQSYFKKESQFGGGGRSYEGWQLPKYYKRYEGGKIRVRIVAQKDKAVLIGFGMEIGNDGVKVVKVKSIIKPTSIKINILN